MTERPYTNADLRAEAARQLALSAKDPNFMGIGERMEGSKIPSRDDFQWDQLDDADFDTAQRDIDDLLTNAVDVSAWAVALGAAGLKPVTEMGVYLTTGGSSLAVQLALDPELTDAAQAELITKLTEAINTTASRVLGCTPVV
jgi:hypothetical protein